MRTVPVPDEPDRREGAHGSLAYRLLRLGKIVRLNRAVANDV